MHLRHHRDLAAPVERVWARATDVRQIAEAFPGGSIDSVDGDAFTGAFTVKVGPVSWKYEGEGRLVEQDETIHRAVIESHGREKRGTARVRLRADLRLTEISESTTRADLETTVDLMGASMAPAGPIAQRISDPIVARFLDDLAGVEHPRRRGLLRGLDRRH